MAPMTSAADTPDHRPPNWELWWQSLRHERNRWAHGPKSVDPFELIWSSARAANIELDWSSLSAAFSLFELPEIDRPAHVGALVRQLATAAQTARVLDPFATAPTFLAQVAEAPPIREAVGIAPNHQLAQHLNSPASENKIRWLAGMPQGVLAGPDRRRLGDGPFDLVTSSPPLAVTQREMLPGDLPPQVYRNDLAHWALATSSQLLSERGLLAFQLTDSLFFKREGRGLLTWLAENHIYPRAAVSLAAGLGSVSSVATSLVVFDRVQREKLFVARLGSDQDPRPLVDNLLAHRQAKAPENGLLVGVGTFRGWRPLQTQLDVSLRLRVSPSQIKPLAEVAVAITPLRLRQGQSHDPAPNAIYIYETSNRVTLEPPDPPSKEKSVFRAYEVALDRDRVLAEFAAWWLSTDVGQQSRAGLSTGAYIPRIARADVGEIRIVVPSLDQQRRALSLDERLRALRDEVAAIEQELAGRPQGAEQLSDRLESYWEDPLEAWVRRLPYPLAAIIDRYIADAGVEAQVERLLHFFEAFAQFGVAVLLAVIQRDEQLWAEHRSDLAEPGPSGRHALEEGTFGGWTSMGFKLAKVLRAHLQDADDANAVRRDLFVVQDERFAADLTSRRLWKALNDARELRNELSHGEHAGRAAKARLREKLKALLTDIREATERCFARAVLVQPGGSDFDGELYLFERARRLQGPNSNLRERPLESLVQLKSRDVYFVDPVDRISGALEVVPLFRLMTTPDSEETTVYFAGGRQDGGYRLVSYQLADPARRVEPAPHLDRLLQKLAND
jgi:hypothetical protein